MEPLFLDTDILDAQRMLAAFGLGKAFEYLHSANKLKRTSFEFSIEKETSFFTLCLEATAGKPFPEGLAQLSEREYQGIGENYVNLLRQSCGGHPVVTDKAPNNFLFVPIIRRLFPQAKIIHCQPEPMDTCFSIYKNFFSGNQLFAYDLGEVGAITACIKS